jgi:hypothetical protein
MPIPMLIPVTEPVALGCEMADSEDECQETPRFWLNSPSYVKPMLCCDTHADEQSYCFGAYIVEHLN